MEKAIILLTTYDCNLRCSYCYEPKRAHHKMNIDTAKQCILKTIDSLDENFEGIIVQFMGGEPLMQFDLIKEVTDWLWTQELNTKIINVQAPTNGTLLNEEMKEWLVANKEKFRLSISFDGDRLMQNINRSMSSSQIDLDFFAKTYPNVPVKMTVSPSTISHFFEGYKYLIDYGFQKVECSLAQGSEVGWKHEHLTILRSELDKFVNYYVANPDVYRSNYFNIPVWNVFNEELPDRFCRIGPEIVCYDYNGRTFPCHVFSPITIEKSRAIESTKIDFNEIRKKDSPCKRCLLNKLCVRCPGMNYKDNKDCVSISSFDCAKYKLFFFANCKLLKILAHNNKNDQLENMIDIIIKVINQ